MRLCNAHSSVAFQVFRNPDNQALLKILLRWTSLGWFETLIRTVAAAPISDFKCKSTLYHETTKKMYLVLIHPIFPLPVLPKVFD